MFTGELKQFLKQTAVFTALLTTTSVLMVIGLEDANAAKPPPTPLSNSVSPGSGSTDEVVVITFTGAT